MHGSSDPDHGGFVIDPRPRKSVLWPIGVQKSREIVLGFMKTVNTIIHKATKVLVERLDPK